MRVTFLLTFVASISLVGCAREHINPDTPVYPSTGATISGKLLSGSLPVVGAHVYLMAVSATGYGSPSVSLLLPSSTGYSDSLGSFVPTSSDGSFTVPGFYVCGAATEVYIYATGGDSGLGNNAAASELAAVGPCPQVGTAVQPILVNEVTTVAAAFALAGFATDALHIASSGTPLATVGVSNAFVNAGKLASLSAGTAMVTVPSSNAIVPQQTIDTLANIAAACIHSSGPSSKPCTTLLGAAAIGTTSPTETASALIGIAHQPAASVPSLFALQSSASPFAPFLTAEPNDFSLGIVFIGGGLTSPTSIAIDGDGNAWIVSEGGGSTVAGITEISSSGAFLSGTSGYQAGLYAAGPIAIDTHNNVWIGNYAADLAGGGSIVELSSTGEVLSGASGYTGGGIRSPNGLGIDGFGNVWVANLFTSTITELSSTGQILSGPNGLVGGGLYLPSFLAVDAANNIWIADQANEVTEFSESGAPISGVAGFTAPGFHGGSALAVDSHGDIWVTNTGSFAQVSKISPAGIVLSGAGYTGGGINQDGGYEIALDGASNAWVPLTGSKTVVELSNSGDALSGPNGYGGGVAQSPLAIAVDGSGDVWVSSAARHLPSPDVFRVTELIGIATPVVTPIAEGTKRNLLGARP